LKEYRTGATGIELEVLQLFSTGWDERGGVPLFKYISDNTGLTEDEVIVIIRKYAKIPTNESK